MKLKSLPVGIEDFKDIITKDYYYVDKSLFIKELIDYKGSVNLFTRPRRFGKTLNLSMLQYFFEQSDADNAPLFQNLSIIDTGATYLSHMGQYPVITISLKSGKQATADLSITGVKKIISEEFRRHKKALEKSLTQKERIQQMMDTKGDLSYYTDAIRFLSECLYNYYKCKVIILIDEYDVPLENAYFNGFYEEMINFIKPLFESALKTNPFMEFAVITGCLRISKESIFTGLNNLEIISITNKLYAEHFGFTQNEIEVLLNYYGLKHRREEIRTWYDGYYFGDKSIYNPWSVINYIKSIWIDNSAFPKPYWSNTSSNSIIRTLIENADMTVKQEIEYLISGGSIEKPIHEDITYEDIDQSSDSLWNFLFFTGYLKQTHIEMKDLVHYMSLGIPNLEVRHIYETKIIEWFREQISLKDLTSFYKAIIQGDIDVFQKALNAMLRESISFYDNKEAFYHGFMLGLLNGMSQFLIDSNKEAGDGRYDIQIRSLDIEIPAVLLELKLADSFSGMKTKAMNALLQMKEKKYNESLYNEGYQKVIHYGIAFYKKNCIILKEEYTLS